MKPSDSAVNFEAVKVSMSQNKEGVMLKLAVHPNDCPASLHTDWIGTRYMVALVRIADDESVVVDKDAEARKRAVAIAGEMCRNERFQTWLVRAGIASAVSEEAAAEGLKGSLLISSRRELESDAVARKKFMELVGSFELDVRNGSI